MTHHWAKLPDKYTGHDRQRRGSQPKSTLRHPRRAGRAARSSLYFVFDEKGVFIQAFGKEFQGGGHGLEVRKETDGEFLYVTGYQHLKKFAKLTLDGEKVWGKIRSDGFRNLCGGRSYQTGKSLGS